MEWNTAGDDGSRSIYRSTCLNTLIEVRIEMPPPSHRAAVLEAHVSRKLKEGVGIEW